MLLCNVLKLKATWLLALSSIKKISYFEYFSSFSQKPFSLLLHAIKDLRVSNKTIFNVFVKSRTVKLYITISSKVQSDNLDGLVLIV